MKLAIFTLMIAGAHASSLRRNLQDETACLPGGLDSFEITTNCRTFLSELETKFYALDPPCGHALSREKRILTGQDSGAAAREYLVDYCELKLAEEEKRKEAALASMFPIKVDGSCTYDSVMEALSVTCDCDSIEAMKTLLNMDENTLVTHVSNQCQTAWGQVTTKAWSDINSDFTDDFMEDFVEGGTILNTETSNLATPENSRYPTSDTSKEYGESINSFYQSNLQKNVLKSFEAMESCASHAMMCCWGRDRQSGDNNGQCRLRDCDDKDPADNSNLCKESLETEGDIHCHGVAWSEDPNDVSAVFRFNNLFYVSMYDHLYTRGYVENVYGSDFTETGIPMCSCVEDMPKVSRADCTEVDADIEFTIDYSVGTTSITAGELVGIDFDACRGIIYGTDQMRGAGNDLASYVNRLEREEKISANTQTTIHATLVGYASPNDNENEAVCNPSVAVL